MNTCVRGQTDRRQSRPLSRGWIGLITGMAAGLAFFVGILAGLGKL